MKKTNYTRITSLAVALIMVFGLALVANASTRGLEPVIEAEKQEERAAHVHGEDCNHGDAETRVERNENGTVNSIALDDKIIIITEENEVAIIDAIARTLTLFKADGTQIVQELSENERPLDGEESHYWYVYECSWHAPKHVWVICAWCGQKYGYLCGGIYTDIEQASGPSGYAY